VAVHIRSGIADRPVKQAELGVVGARHPGRSTGVLDRLAFPGLGAGLSGKGRGPESPALLAGFLLVCADEPARARVASSYARDDQIADSEGSCGGAVVLARVRQFDLPCDRTGESVQREKVRVVGDHEHPGAADCDAAVDRSARITDEPFAARPLIMPY